jgi:hypothetical protein
VTDTQSFALILLVAAVGLVVVLSNRLTERLKVPTPALVLVGAAVAVKVVPALHEPPHLLLRGSRTLRCSARSSSAGPRRLRGAGWCRRAGGANPDGRGAGQNN